MKSIIANFFESIDIYGAYTYFTIEKNIQSKTITGGIFSLLSFVFFILYTILNSLVYDPLVTFKFMLPFMKNNTQKEKD